MLPGSFREALLTESPGIPVETLAETAVAFATVIAESSAETTVVAAVTETDEAAVAPALEDVNPILVRITY